MWRELLLDLVDPGMHPPKARQHLLLGHAQLYVGVWNLHAFRLAGQECDRSARLPPQIDGGDAGLERVKPPRILGRQCIIAGLQCVWI